MRILAGWLLGVATAWAALAIWRTIPPFPELDYEQEPLIEDDIDALIFQGRRP